MPRLFWKARLKMDPDITQFSIATPFPGSRYFRMLDEKGYIVSKNWGEYDGYNKAVIRTKKLTARELEVRLCLEGAREKALQSVTYFFVKGPLKDKDSLK